MAKKTARKSPAPVSKKRKKKPPKRNTRQIVISVLIGLALVAFVLPDIMRFFDSGPKYSPPSTSNTPSATNPNTMPEPEFIKEGELSIISGETREPIKNIDIEKADNNDERMFGLMFRRKMEETQGMLFIFDRSEPQSFWMKNTYIPLDIIFIDEDFKITTIRENTVPHSEAPVPSDGKAKYVLEVNGGWCERYGVKVGDVVKW